MPSAWLRRAAAENTSPVGPTDGVIASGREEGLADAILGTVAGAEEVVILTSFLIAWRSLVEVVTEVAQRGVRVYVMTASEQRIGRRERTDDELEEERIREHIELLEVLSAVAQVRTAPGFHAKSVLVDPGGEPSAWLLTANLTHSALTLNDEIGVRLTEAESASLFSILRFGWWEMAEHHVTSGALHALTPSSAVAANDAFGPVLSTTPRGNGLLDELTESVASASSLTITNYSWSAEHPVTLAVKKAANDGADVTVIARVSENTAWSGPVLADLADSGVTVMGTERMHGKVLVADGGVLVHTMNFGMIPDGKGLELGLALNGVRAEAVRTVVDAWRMRAPWRLSPDGEPRPDDEAQISIGGPGYREVDLR